MGAQRAHTCSSSHPPLELGRAIGKAIEEAGERSEDDSLDGLAMLALTPLLRRHRVHDWGSISDPHENRRALKTGDRILSVYEIGGVSVWIITDAESDVCPACWTGIGICEPDRGEWVGDIHFRTDVPPRRVSTTVLLPRDY